MNCYFEEGEVFTWIRDRERSGAQRDKHYPRIHAYKHVPQADGEHGH